MTQARVQSETMPAADRTPQPAAVACLYDLIEMSDFILAAAIFIPMLSRQLL